MEFSDNRTLQLLNPPRLRDGVSQQELVREMFEALSHSPGEYLTTPNSVYTQVALVIVSS